MTDTRDLVHVLAELAAGLGYDALTEQAREAAKKSLLATLGVSLAASGLEPAVRAVAGIVREAGGAPQCTLSAFGGRAPAVMAALHNGALVHRLDYDDMTPWGQVPGNADNPMSWEDICAKFRECVSVAVDPPGDEQVARAVASQPDLFRDLYGARRMVSGNHFEGAPCLEKACLG